MTTATDVIVGIVNGEFDDDLERIYQAYKSRRKEAGRKQAEVNRLTLTPGTRVRLKGISPKRLNGREGVVIENVTRHKSAIAVDLDVADGINPTVVPAQCVEAL